MKSKLNKDRRKEIGHLLQLERRYKKLKQEDVARKLGFRQDIISKIEAGKRGIDVVEWIGYCEALNIPVAEFAGKIETYLHSKRILQLPKSYIKERRIGVSVYWHEGIFTATFGRKVRGITEFTADKFGDIQEKTKNLFNAHVKAMVRAGKYVDRWADIKSYSFAFKFNDVRAMLKAYKPYVSLAAISEASGINENLLSQYLNGNQQAGPRQMKRIADAINDIGKTLTAIAI
ncbi:MAG: helix-turn-helix transcriptional regulator [Bacteroidaceae bacterium]|nr:helix-turn-helix transcriptional regulator [Bacteroidaceae bacterium]